MPWRAAHQHHRRPLRSPHRLEQRATLVNAKLKWVKDRALDSVVSREKHLPLILSLVHSSAPPKTLAAARLRDPASFLRRFPAIFSPRPSDRPFSLSAAALRLREEEVRALALAEPDLADRLRRLLMLTAGRSLPLHTIDLLRHDLGLATNYRQTLIPRYPQFFSVHRPPDDERPWLRLLSWDPLLAVSELQRRSENGGEGSDLAFPISFPRGFGLKRKRAEWLREWQTLPYASPYAGPSGLDPRTDEAEKRVVGVFHEMLHLMVGKKTERRNVSNMRKVLGMPQKFTKVFERHPGIFYISQKLGTHTVVLREGYGGGRELIERHPIVGVREKYLELMRVRREDLESEEDGGDESEGDLGEYSSSDEE